MTAAPPTTLLVGRVATMTGSGVLTDQAVTIADGRIAAITPREQADLVGPVLDWRRRTLLPGLADMHSHVWERAHMLLNLAHGVTLLRNTWGNPWHLRWQREVAAGRELGPHLVTTSPMADGRGAAGITVWPTGARIDGPDAAHVAVARWAALGYQAVKAYSWLDAPSLRALGDACRDAGIPLVGHCPQALTVEDAIDAGQTGFEHLNGYETGALTPDAQQFLDTHYPPGRIRLAPDATEAMAQIDGARLADLCQRLADQRIVSTPTMVVFDGMFGPRDPDDPRLRYVDPAYRRFWEPANDFRLDGVAPADLARSGAATRERTTRVLAALRDAGAPVQVGTDPPNPYVFHGSSVVEELERFVECGYTSAEVLAIATRDAADNLGLADRGRIAVGCVADLLAVEGDPLSSVSALRDPAAVVVGGTVLDRAALDALLAEAEALLHGEPELRWDPLEPDEELVGEYERTEFGHPTGRTRVSCCSPGPDLRQWREQVIARGRRQTTTTVIDLAGHLVSARLDVQRDGATEHAEVTRSADGGSYRVALTALDGSTTDVVLDGPLLPGADLGTPALLAAADLAGEDLEGTAVLSVAASLANGLPPRPGTLRRDGTALVQHTTDALARVEADDDRTRFEVTMSMVHLAHERVD